MIKSFKHKGLRLLWEEGKTNRLPVELVSRMLEIIDSATEVPDDFGAFPNWNLHRLSGNMKNYWNIKVNKNYRIIFQFDGQHVYDVDYLDYH